MGQNSSAYQFHMSHRWRNPYNLDKFARKMSRSIKSVIDKDFGYNQCTWQQNRYAWSTRNYCVGQREKIHFCTIWIILKEPRHWAYQVSFLLSAIEKPCPKNFSSIERRLAKIKCRTSNHPGLKGRSPAEELTGGSDRAAWSYFESRFSAWSKLDSRHCCKTTR